MRGLQDLGLLDNGILLREFDAVVDNPNGVFECGYVVCNFNPIMVSNTLCGRGMKNTSTELTNYASYLKLLSIACSFFAFNSP